MIVKTYHSDSAAVVDIFPEVRPVDCLEKHFTQQVHHRAATQKHNLCVCACMRV